MRAARIALYGGGGAPYHHAAVLARGGHELSFVYPVDVREGALAGFDAFVMPGGGYRAMQGQIDPLGAAGARAIADYVRGGGMYLGSCAGSYDAAVVAESFVRACPAQREMCLLDARVWNEGDTEWLGLRSPGVGVLRSRTVASGHPVMAGMPERFEIAHYNGPFFRGGEELALVEGPAERFTPAERFFGPFEGRTLVEEAAEVGVANVVAGACGRGRVVLFGSHPEFGFRLAMDDEQAPARMLRNAVEWQLEESGAPERPRVELFADRAATEEDPERVAGLAERLRERCEELRERPGRPRWLEPAYAMSVFGLSPGEVWRQGLDEIERLAGETAERAPHVEPGVLGMRPPAEWELDGGYHGVVPLLEQADRLLADAGERWDADLGKPSPDAYAFALTSPYHLVAGSYLAAVGRVASAALLCSAYERVPA